MDIQNDIDVRISKLRQLRQKLEKEIESYEDDIQQVRDEDLGVMNKIKALAGRHMNHTSGMESVLGEAYALKKNQEFRNAQEFVDERKFAISHTREAISRVDQLIANLEQHKRDINYQFDAVKTWLQQADEALK